MTTPMRMYPRGVRLPKSEDILDSPVDASVRSARAWREVRLLLRGHRGYLVAGIVLTLVSRLAGLVLPASSKYFIDHVLVEKRTGLLLALAGIVVVATIRQAATGFAFARLRPINRERNWEFARVTGRLNEALGGIRVLKAYVAERREDLIFTRGVHRMLRLVVVTLSGWAAVGALTSLVVGAIGATLILAGGRAVLSGSLTLGDLAMYALFTGLVAAPLIQVAQVGTQLSDAVAGLERARELLDEPTEDGNAPTGEPRARLAGAVQLEDVSFEYRAGVPALRNVSFAAPAGSTTALVGPSGSGKSTLLGLRAAFQRPTTGRIRIDGSTIGSFDLRRYRAQLGLVLQDTFLFDGTILENISYSRPDATLAEVKRVAVVAHCDEFIERMPERYDTVVGERGVKLSGGQRQRVAIARALLADPSILLLDEATSSLDSESEALIQNGLDALRRGRTTFVIAHRLSTILSADKILVLDGGRLVEEGTHDELLALGGRYARLYDQQQRAARNRFVNPGEELTELR